MMTKHLLMRGWLVLALVGLVPAASAAERQTIVTAPDGMQLTVQEAGNPARPAIVFIHGLLGSRLNWELQVASPDLQRYRLITYDLRGHGLSGKPEDPEAYRDGRRYADDLAAVLKATGAKKPVLVGWSLGGVVISNYLAAYGDTQIGALVYVDGVIELNAALITAHPDVYAGMASADLKTHLDAVRAFLALCFHTQPDRATFERLLANAAMASWPMTKATPSMTVSAAESLPKVRVPLLALYGAKDELVNTQPSLARLKELQPRAQARVYANSGHAPFLEEAQRFNRDLATFVDAAQK
jgi:pimeloyl-ACP methyl ester carboxylesterase